MNYTKKVIISLGYIVGPIIIGLFILTILNYFDIISYNLFNIMKIILLCLSIILGGIKIGEKSKQKGWMEGIKLGLIISIILLIFNYLIFRVDFNFKQLFYFVIIFGSSILGSILGINIKKKNS